jgi:competence CoiA-like predicted nuclease
MGLYDLPYMRDMDKWQSQAKHCKDMFQNFEISVKQTVRSLFELEMAYLDFISYVSEENEKADEKPSFVYFIKNTETECVKIGKANCPESRLKELQTGASGELKIIGLLKFANSSGAYEAEKYLHEYYNKYRIRLGQGTYTKKSEWFSLPIDWMFDEKEQINIVNNFIQRSREKEEYNKRQQENINAYYESFFANLQKEAKK